MRTEEEIREIHDLLWSFRDSPPPDYLIQVVLGILAGFSSWVLQEEPREDMVNPFHGMIKNLKEMKAVVSSHKNN